MKAILTKALFMLIILNLGTVSVFAQDHTIQKPVRQQSTTTTTTTTTTQQKPRTNSTATKPTTGTINGHEWVDLGLSVKWATCNVGASYSLDYGDYYAWGEISTKSEYTKKNSETYGKSMGNIAGNSQYDAARANWGGTWRLPTADEIDELVNKCKRTWITKEGHNGFKVTGPNGNSIFLPAAGWRTGTLLNNAGKLGIYWSSTPYWESAGSAFSLSLGSGYLYRYWHTRSNGQSVRPVSD